tara:strand:- start:211724 stop:211948 length:225 start_codon:yes stop_codon:yes gene_type:complete
LLPLPNQPYFHKTAHIAAKPGDPGKKFFDYSELINTPTNNIFLSMVIASSYNIIDNDYHLYAEISTVYPYEYAL